ncbi:RFIP5 protein, partial [Onychorhynchus coronatus]|nr:RFIP5 protein [Onychorhynchus coronatus]
WLPTHVQVTVVRARGLRCKGGTGAAKGKAGGSDAYTVIQLGREKYSTSVAEKSGGSPEWREECAFELPPEPGPRAGLVLTVMHRALVGMDRFLGQAVVPLEPARQRGREPDERWHKLHSKAGKKEKERGEILVSIQFTRNNLTASMFDLSMKDKPRSPFGKLKDKVTGKKKYDLESASAIIPSSLGALDVEDDYEMGGKKAKVKGFFLKNKLRKSSLTQSNTSLGSDSTISSASLSLAANVPEVTKSPSRHSSLSMERSVKDYLPSPKLTHKRAFSDDVSQVSPVLEPKATQSLKPKNDPVSRSSLCINGSHVYSDEPAPKSPALVPPGSAPLPVPAVPRRQEEGFGFAPLHPDPHEAPWGVGGFDRSQQRDEPRFIPSPPSLALQEELKVSTKAVTLSNHLGRARMEESSRLENRPTQAAAPRGLSSEAAKDQQPEEPRKEEKKPKGGFFHHGGNRSDAGSKGQGEKAGASVQAAATGDERSKGSGWFGSKEPKDSPQKPSLEVSPQVETSSDAPSHFPPCSPAPFPPAHLARMPSSNLPPATGDSQAGCLSPTNPFLNSLQSNPFFEDLLADQVLNSPSPTHFFSSFPCGPHASPELPPPDTEPAAPPPLSEWDDTFDAFATSRLKPEGKKENFFASLAAEGMAFIDDPDAASPTERAAKPAHEQGTQGFEKADSQIGGTNGWMTIATETAPEPSESTQSVAEEHAGQDSVFGPRPAFLGDGAFEANSASRAAARVLPRSTFPPELAPETLPGSKVVAVPPRVLAEVAARPLPAPPEPGTELQGAGNEEDAFDIRTSVYRLQASMRLEASESLVKLSSDIRERHVILSPWTGTQEREEIVATSAVPPPKPPRWFAATGVEGAGEEEEARGPQQGSEERGEDKERPKADVELPRSRVSSEPSVPASPSPSALGSWSQPHLSPQMGSTDSAKWEMASKQDPFPEELSISELNPPSKLDLGQPEMFWTALEEQEAAAHPAGLSPRLARREISSWPEPAWDDGEGQEGHQPEPCAPVPVASPPEEAEQGRPPHSEPKGPWHSANIRIDFKKADFWKPDRAEERHKQEAPSPKNPFTLALSPNSPSNPFVETPPDPLPAQAVLPEKLDQGDFSFASLHEEALGQGFQPANPAGHPLVQPPFPHVSQPLAFSTPFLVAATNPEQFGFPSPAVFPASSGVPAASSRAAAQPCPLPQPGDTQASALVVLPRETQPAEKPLFQQTTSPHPVKPISAAVQEVSAEKKQQHRSSLTSALSNGLEKLRTVTTSSVQPVAPTSHPEKTDSKKLKDPTVLDQSAKYYHLTHDELIQLLLQREMELSKKEEHIHELENYIDQLLVRIMEQSPTLLQIPLGEGNTK